MTEIFVRTVKPIGNTGHVIIPKRFIGRRVTIIINEDDDEGEGEKNKIGGKCEYIR